MNLGELLKAYRKDKKLSVREFAKRIGVDDTTLWRIERGENETCKQWPAILRWVFGK